MENGPKITAQTDSKVNYGIQAVPMAFYMSTEEPMGVCLECGKPLRSGRSDRKFCCVACKNKYNNRRARNSRNFMSRVWSILQKNHMILSNLIRLGVDEISCADLSALGFNYECITSWRRIRGHIEVRCFDIVYIVTEKKVFGIRRVVTLLSDVKRETIGEF